MAPSISLGLHAAGLIVLYSLYGLLQERIMKGRYGPEQEKFTAASLLVLCNRLFSMFVGIAIILLKSMRRGTAGSSAGQTLGQRLKPASPIYAYCAVAVLNFLATFCQYQALSYVDFTTQALAKTIKMVPVLVISRLVYKKTHKARQWVAAMVVLVGCATYLTSRPDPKAATTPQESRTFLDAILGTFFLLGYLGLDGLTSTTQERVFGKNPNSADPFGDDSPVLDQMVWVNLFASLISAVGAAVSFPLTIHSLGLMLTEWGLLADILLLSATAAVGLIVLLNTIAAYGALTSSTIMTVRQFLSILLNAGVFGNFASVGTQGWLGVGWVASGIFIKMDSRWDPPKAPKTAGGGGGIGANKSDLSLPLETTGNSSSVEKEGLLPQQHPDSDTTLFDADKPDLEYQPPPPPAHTPVKFQWARQYGPPILLPLLVAGLFTLFFPGAASETPLNSVPVTPPGAVLDSAPQHASEHGNAMAVDEKGDASKDYQEESADDLAKEVAAIPDSAVEGGRWANELHASLSPNCPHTAPDTKYYDGQTPMTALATFPRSGNSYLRSMIERSTGFRTSSVYCDHTLAETFLGECTADPFLRKTHYPANHVPEEADDTQAHWTQFARHVHLVRNPFDAIFSYYNFKMTHSHEDRVEVGKLGEDDSHMVLLLARRWVEHAQYWDNVPLRSHELRYEDLRENPLPSLMSLLSFLLPADQLPSLEDLACVVELNEAAEAYHSRKSEMFAAWDRFTPELREQVLDIVKPKFCRYGYDQLAAKKLGKSPVDCKDLTPNLPAHRKRSNRPVGRR